MEQAVAFVKIWNMIYHPLYFFQQICTFSKYSGINVNKTKNDFFFLIFSWISKFSIFNETAYYAKWCKLINSLLNVKV